MIGGILSGIGAIAGAANQYAVDMENLGLQKERYAYQKALQEKIFEREDSSIQRRVADLRSAGLSPVLAAGQGARAGAAIPVTAPQRGRGGPTALAAVAPAIAGVMSQLATVDKTKAETGLIKAQARRANVEANVAAQTESYVVQKHMNELHSAIRHNEFLRRTLDGRIGKVLSEWRNVDARTAETQAREALTSQRYNSEYVDLQWKYALEQYVRERYGVENPQVVEYLTGRAAQSVKEADAELWKAIRASGMAGQIGGAIIKLIK